MKVSVHAWIRGKRLDDVTVRGGIWEIVPAGDQIFEARRQNHRKIKRTKERRPQRIVVGMAWGGICRCWSESMKEKMKTRQATTLKPRDVNIDGAGKNR